MTSHIVCCSTGACAANGQPSTLPGYEMDDHRVPGKQAPTHTHVRETLPGTPGGLCQGGQCHQEETRAPQDG